MIDIIRAGQKEAVLLASALVTVHVKAIIQVGHAAAFLADPRCLSFLAMDEDDIVGSLYGYALRRPDTDRPKFFLYEIDVIESHRRQGIGRALVKAFLKEAKRQDAIAIWSRQSR